MAFTTSLWLQAAIVSLILTTLTSAQSVNFASAAPSCAQSCPVITTAQQTCNSAGGTVVAQANCFCQQPTITALEGSGASCASTCSSAQQQSQVQQWASSLCSNPNTVTVAPGAAATGAAGGSGGTQTGSSSSATTSTTLGNAANDAPANDNRSWWDQHARWIVMVIVLIVAFTILIILGVWWKRRHARKRNAMNNIPASAVWGPQQSHPSGDRFGGAYSNAAGYHGRDAEKYMGAPTVTQGNSNMSGALRPGRGSMREGGTGGELERGRSAMGTNRSSEGAGKRLQKIRGLVSSK